MDFGLTNKIAKTIMRPPRSLYSPLELGENQFAIWSRNYERIDFTATNQRNMLLHASYFREIERTPSLREAIIFLHANSSSRLHVKNYLHQFLPYFDIIAFDFAGCGLSEGEFITLGYNEKEDVKAITATATRLFNLNEFILWGRSMGAATALLYAAKYNNVKAVIADSSFSDLDELTAEIVAQYIPVLPRFLLNTIISSTQSYIDEEINPQERSRFSIRLLKPIDCIHKIQCPVLFITSKEDQLVDASHTHSLYKQAKDGTLQITEGDHNAPRTEALRDKILKFIVDLPLRKSQLNSKLNETSKASERSRSRRKIFEKRPSTLPKPSSTTELHPKRRKILDFKSPFDLNYLKNEKVVSPKSPMELQMGEKEVPTDDHSRWLSDKAKQLEHESYLMGMMLVHGQGQRLKKKRRCIFEAGMTRLRQPNWKR